jgi:N6-adenosine-specific RNA methylase IME4
MRSTEAVPLPLGEYDVVLADPPWKFASNSVAAPGRNPQRHYPTLSVDQIAAMPVAHLAAPNALLLLWVTVPIADRGPDVMAAWGFRYVSQIVWIKDRIGLGYWARNRHELLLIGTRGRFPCPVPTMFPDSVIIGQQREHSRKPDEVHERIEAATRGARRLELFARAQRDGWTVWGNQTALFSAAAE